MRYFGATTATWRDDRGPLLVMFHWAEIEGSARCIGVDIRGFARTEGSQGQIEPVPGAVEVHEVTASLPSRMRLSELMADSRGEQWFLASVLSDEGAPAPQKVRELAAAQREAFETPSRTRAGVPLFWTVERLQEALAIYEAAPPRRRMAAVQEHFGISKSAAAKVLARARTVP